ncbi:hypothetical protein V3851_00975 [Paenibacillus sp. M1]|uniref:Gliding motility-associated protein GldM N-terminal domain-containing protein n=1 Tax=Paenibacillus haidiansis TaxID=1574488 RepID=A0ABU7VKV6_9BACL
MKRKKSSRFEIWFSLGFLFTLVVAFGTFFLGLNMGITRTEAKYLNFKASVLQMETDASYSQQDLVTFYYVAFEPYQQFKEEFLELNDWLKRSDNSLSAAKALKDAQASAKAQYELIASYSVSDASPLLEQAQSDILKSLKLFEEGIGRNLSFIGGETGPKLVSKLSQDEFTVNAIDYGLKAQSKFYASIMKWNAKSDKSIPDSYSFRNDTTVAQWQAFTLSQKNKAVTDIMLNGKLYVSYLPQDMTAKIDQMINSGKASALKLNSVASIVKILTETEAVQSKEFIKWRSTYYASELLPLLPFFGEDY